MTDDHTGELAKQICDAISICTVLGTIVNALPEIAALFSIVWTLIRIFESTTVQNILIKWEQRREGRAKRSLYSKSLNFVPAFSRNVWRKKKEEKGESCQASQEHNTI